MNGIGEAVKQRALSPLSISILINLKLKYISNSSTAKKVKFTLWNYH